VAAYLRRSRSHLLLGLLLLAFAAQVVVGLALLATGLGTLDTTNCWLGLGRCGPFQMEPFGLPQKPWSLLTNLFAHGNVLHLAINALVLYFLGPHLEARIGGRGLLRLFLLAGVAASLAHVALAPLLGVPAGTVVGASGAIFALLGTLTALVPRMQVIFIFVPAPLWVVTALLTLFDLAGLGLLSPLGLGQGAGGVAFLAHLTGLALGLLWGWHLQRRGVLPRVATWASQRRY
jgi:hypothetical protein